MKEIWAWIQAALVAVGGFLGWFVGGFDGLLYALIALMAADYVIDLGPRAGRLGGQVVFEGTPQEMLKQNTLTSNYLTGVKQIESPTLHRAGNGKQLVLKGATGNNLKNVDFPLPLEPIIATNSPSYIFKSTPFKA